MTLHAFWLPNSFVMSFWLEDNQRAGSDLGPGRAEHPRGLLVADDDREAGGRVRAGTVHPTAPLPGRTGMASSGACRQLEEAVLAGHAPLVEALAELGLDAERRATRLPVTALEWQCAGDTLELAFRLPTGAFATAVLAEVLTTRAP